VFWVLLSLLLLLCLVALALCLLSLWRRVKVLGRQVGEVGTTVAAAQQAVEDAKAGGPLAIEPCPTCGTPVQARVLRRAAVRAEDSSAA
jgi:hypothetical protein